MAIVPAADPRRLSIRRQITLDLFMRYGETWTRIAELRAAFGIEPVTAIPPEPDYHVAVAGLLTRWQMPERFHLPPGIDPFSKAQIGEYLFCLRDLARVIVPEVDSHGTDATGWLGWTPFLSACLLYDPPGLELRAFADHDDDNAAAITQHTFSQDVVSVREAEWRHSDRQLGAAGTPQPERELRFVASLDLRRRELAATYRPSRTLPPPSRRRGRQWLDELTSVQAALLKRSGRTYPEITRRLKLPSNPDAYDPRDRKNSAIDHVRRGEEILASRNKSGE